MKKFLLALTVIGLLLPNSLPMSAQPLSECALSAPEIKAQASQFPSEYAVEVISMKDQEMRAFGSAIKTLNPAFEFEPGTTSLLFVFLNNLDAAYVFELDAQECVTYQAHGTATSLKVLIQKMSAEIDKNRT